MNTPDCLNHYPITLALDTSAKSTSLALTRGKEALALLTVAGDERRSERLWLDLDGMLAGAGMTIGAVELFGVCVGPGSFTGLRVGVAAAKGLAAAAGRPLAGVTSLEAAAAQAGRASAVCAMVGAYKGEVYWQLFSVEGEGLPVALSEPLVSTSNEAVNRIAALPDLVFAGDAVASSVEAIREAAGSRFIEDASESARGWRIEPPAQHSAEAVARVAVLKWQRGGLASAEELQAVYVRPAEAEVKRALGLLGSKIERSRKAE